MSQVSRYLDPTLVEHLNQMQLSARSVVQGATIGQHRSPVREADSFESRNGHAGFFDQEHNGFAYEEPVYAPTIEAPAFRGSTTGVSPRRSRPPSPPRSRS